MDIKSELEQRIEQAKKASEYASEQLENAPEGRLYVRKEKKSQRFYCRLPKETIGQYLAKDDLDKVKALQAKEYYELLKKQADTEVHKLTYALNIIEKAPNHATTFLKMKEEKRNLITPYCEVNKDDLERELNRWKRNNGPKKYINPAIKYITQNGEHVRSKSELIIADRLKSADIPYCYESDLMFAEEKLGQFVTWHPDFKVMNRRTQKQYYWEHFGLMDQPDYCSECIYKLETYAEHGFFQGQNLIVTMESSQHGLNTQYIDQIIEHYLK